MSDLELTRRDALAALAATGVAGLSVASLTGDEAREDAGLSAHDLATLQAVAEVVYPAEVEGIEPFVETYVLGRVADRPDHVAGIRDAVETVDASARTWEDAALADLDVELRDLLLRRTGVAGADADPEGADRERIRYYLVNELLYVLYTSPPGGELVGIENPQGHPGGTDSYRRGPDG